MSFVSNLRLSLQIFRRSVCRLSTRWSGLFIISVSLPILDLLESLNGEHKDQVSPIGALKFILERHISNLDNWAITTKVFIILHRALQNKRVNRKVIKDLKKNEHLLHPY